MVLIDLLLALYYLWDYGTQCFDSALLDYAPVADSKISHITIATHTTSKLQKLCFGIQYVYIHKNATMFCCALKRTNIWKAGLSDEFRSSFTTLSLQNIRLRTPLHHPLPLYPTLSNCNSLYRSFTAAPLPPTSLCWHTEYFMTLC